MSWKPIIIVLILLPIKLGTQGVLTQQDLKRNAVLTYAEEFLGKPYKHKHGNQIFDCSGYVRYILSKVDVVVTRSSISQIHDGKRVEDIHASKPGDILVFRGRTVKNSRPGHVGLVHHWSGDTLYFIHSSVQKGITIDHMFDPYYKKRFLQVRNVID